MTKSNKRVIRRKKYFIKKSFQTEFFLGFVLLLIFQAFIVTGIFISLSNQTLTTGFQGSRFVIDKTSNFFFLNFIVVGLVVAVCFALAGMLIFIFLSHRIAGPLYKFEKALNAASKGDLAMRVSLRRTDELRDLQNALNATLISLDQHVKEIKGDVKGAELLLSREEGEGHRKELKGIIERIKDKVAFFRTS